MEEKIEALKRLSILCVEDEDGIRERLMKSLGYYFAHVYGARDGKEGYQLYKEKKVRALLCE